MRAPATGATAPDTPRLTGAPNQTRNEMPSFTAQDVKKLRDATGAGMMDAKRALEEADGDFDAAAEVLRIKQGAKVTKKAGERETSNGIVATTGHSLLELRCETDFVAKGADFQALAARLVAHVDATGLTEAEALLASDLDGKTVAETITDASAKIGEKFELGGIAKFDGTVCTYMHKRSADLPPQVGVLVEFSGDDVDTARGAAMQIAAMKAQYVTRDEVPADVVANERRIAEATSREEGKPEAALPKIIEGRVNGFFKEVVLTEQASVQDSKKTVKAVLDAAGVTITRFARFEAGA